MTAQKKDYVDIPYCPNKKTRLIFFNSFAEAKQNAHTIKEEAKKFEQCIIVIRDEGSCEDSEILGLGSNILLYAGRAWTIIFERRQEDQAYII